eukprot:maker-scaffold1021_size70145-snap-gene-0.16 protein:Tk02177 transcript:maker-scaffold1021_size70145-snap-gene-0.16-mRNA-1 annotation:"sodium potassium calcium exchanger nckx30c isoform x5"
MSSTILRMHSSTTWSILIIAPFLLTASLANEVPQAGRRLLELGDENDGQGLLISPQANDTADPLFPPDLFSSEQLSHGAVVFHFLGIIYMFYALALVCDEYFVPSLDVIAEKLEISPDVAGATFMAAGGSAPELFTSIIGVFIAKSDVGIGTIVGSAVFNILFVIAVCAFVAKEALSLTAWPLVRDVFFYSISLGLLVTFFLDNQITWYEALILFLWYGTYVGFMAVNGTVEDFFRRILKQPPRNIDTHAEGITLRSPKHRRGLFHLMNASIHPKVDQGPSSLSQESQPPVEYSLKDSDQATDGGISMLKSHLQTGAPASDLNDLGQKSDDVGNIKLEGENQDNLPNPKWDGNDDQLNVDEIATDEPIDMSFPKQGSPLGILVYVISLPIMLPLYCTLPDTRNAKWRQFFMVTFVGSILWIAAYSYLMVWWATVVGSVLGIPDEIMGLTLLAAGTSVPDLITSVLVARKGKGDMAVSSSVGSNIFDVTVGLPLPWLIYTVAMGESVSVQSAGVGCSIGLLFSMLLLVFLSIVAFQWKMTKPMGMVMLVLYFGFVAVSLGFSYELFLCPF